MGPALIPSAMTNLALPALVTIAALILYQGCVLAVGKSRASHGVKAPVMTGPEAFERVVRVQQNTLEQLVSFLPSYWLASLLSQADMANVLGILWIAGRLAYAVGYVEAPQKRGAGFAIAWLSSTVLLIMGLVGAIRVLA